MVTPQKVDYDALAKQYGATTAPPQALIYPPQSPSDKVDYDQLASKFGGSQAPPKESEEPGILGKMWDWANKGLIPKDTIVRAMTGMTPEDLDKALASYPEETPVHAAIREFARGTMQDTAGTASSFTSPASIAMAGAGAVGKGAQAVGELAKVADMADVASAASKTAAATKVAGATGAAVFGAQGAKDIYEAGSETTPEAWQHRLQGAAMATGGAAGVGENMPEAMPSMITDAARNYRTNNIVKESSKQADNLTAALEMGGAPPKGVVTHEEVSEPILDDFRSSAAQQGITAKDFDGRKGYRAAQKIAGDVRAQYDNAYQQLVEPLANENVGNAAQSAAKSFLNKIQGDAELVDELTNSNNMKQALNLYHSIRNAGTIGELDAMRVKLNRLASKFESKTSGQQYEAPLFQEALQQAANNIREQLYNEMSKRYGGAGPANGESLGITEADIRELQKRHGAAIKADQLMETTARHLSSRAAEEGAPASLWQRMRGLGYRATLGRPQHAAAGIVEKILPPSEVELFNARMKRVLKGAKAGSIETPTRPLEGEYVGPKEVPNVSTNAARLKLKAAPPTIDAQDTSVPIGQLPPGQYEAAATNIAEPKQLTAENTNGVPLNATPVDEATKLLRAKSQLVRDPNTGRMRRMLTTSPELEQGPYAKSARAAAGETETPNYTANRQQGFYGIKNKLVSQEEYAAARKAFMDKAGRSHTGLDPTALADLAKMGAYHLEAGFNEFADWSKEMIKQAGERARPYLQQVWGDLHKQVGSTAGAKQDTDFFNKAKQELGADASMSDVAKRAQELKEDAQPNAPTFYSKAEKIAEEKLPAKMSGDQALATLKNNGVSQEQLDWLGPEKIKGKNWTKPELMQFIRQNDVQVQEVYKGGLSPSEQARLAKIDEVLRNPDMLGKAQLSPDDRRFYDEATQRENFPLRSGTATKFEQHQEPGGENYRELLLTLPPKPVKPANVFEARPQGGGIWTVFDKNQGHFTSAILESEAEAQSIAQHYNQRYDEQMSDLASFTRSHWAEPNVLAHIRFNDRVDADGKKTLFLEELQSDWHQKGRAQGYDDGVSREMQQEQVDQAQEAKDKNVKNLIDIMRNRGLLAGIPRDVSQSADSWLADATHYLTHAEENDLSAEGKAELKEAISKTKTSLENWREENTLLKKYENTVPDAPFKTNWQELALKRMLRYAAENGYERMAWTTGAMQAARYDLSQHVDKIEYLPAHQEFNAFKGDSVVISKHNVKPEQIADLVGKDAAKKLLETPLNGPAHELSGEQLKIEAPGMIGFYDKMLPNFLNKYAKKWGARVGETNLSIGKPEAPEFRAFKRDDWMAMAGAEPFRKNLSGVRQTNYEPIIATTRIKLNGREQNVEIVADKNGIQIMGESDMLGQASWNDMEEAELHAGNTPRNSHEAMEFIKDYWDEPLLWSILSEPPNHVEPISNSEKSVHTIDITPTMKRDVLKKGQPISEAEPSKSPLQEFRSKGGLRPSKQAEELFQNA